MKVAVLYSGGKDSIYALHWAWLQGFRIACLVTVFPRPYSRMYHYPSIESTLYQAKAMDIPILYRRAREEDDELSLLRKLFIEARDLYGVEGVVAGALLSDYQRMRISLVAEEAGLKTYTPLWRVDQESYMREVVGNGIRFIITSVSAYGLRKDYVGMIVDEDLLEELLAIAKRYGLNPAFEGGEAETLVVDAPLFKKKLCVKGYVVEDGLWSARLVITRIWLNNRVEIELEEN